MPNEEDHRKLAAIMFTDMVGYSALTQRNESLALDLVREQQLLLRPILAQHKGREINTTGDGFLVEFASALQATRCAIEIQKALVERNSSAPAEMNGWYLVASGQIDEGLAESRRAVELDPLSPEINTVLGFNLYFARRYDEAIQQLRTAVASDPDYWYAHLWLGRAYARTGRFSEAVAELHTAQPLEGPENREIASAIGRAYADGGDRAEATKVLNHLRERMHDEFVSAAFVATLHAGLGEVDEALASLAQAEAQHSYYVPWWKVDPELDPLRSDPRFTTLLKKVGLEP